MSKQGEAIERATRELDNLARKLRLNVRPAHVDYVSKANAAAIIERVTADLLRDGREP